MPEARFHHSDPKISEFPRYPEKRHLTPLTLITEVSHTAGPSSFAYSTVRSRWPIIVQNAITDVEHTIANLRAQSHDRSSISSDVEASKVILTRLEKLLHDMASDAPLLPVTEDGDADIMGYNDEVKFLAETGQGKTWHSAPWLFLECYMYRLLHTFFSSSHSPFWSSYDVFASTKDGGLKASKAGTAELCAWYLHAVHGLPEGGKEVRDEALLEEVLSIALWGNATDLSLLTTISMEELHSRQGRKAREAAKRNVIVDDTSSVAAYLTTLPSKPKEGSEMHIVLDNAGFELLADLVLALWLLKAGYAKRVVLHGKGRPWFVSDVTGRDLEFLFDSLMNASASSMSDDDQVDSQPFGPLTEGEAAPLREFGAVLRSELGYGRLVYETDLLWTTQHHFGRMEAMAPELYARLAGSQLVVFKGDLNYRKLVGDGMWDMTTPFAEALGALAKPTSDHAMRVLALRGCKADVVVGLAERVEERCRREGGDEWMRTGRYAVVSFNSGRTQKDD
jgi:hypothetical protein